MSLPSEIDFEADRDASPARMNRAMAWIQAQLRVAQATAKTYEAVIADLRALGLARVAEALTPVFVEAQQVGANLAAIQAQWEDETLVLANHYTKAETDAGFAPLAHIHDQGDITGLAAALALLAPLASPALTGNPTAPTQATGNNSTRLATTAFVQAAITALINGSPGALDTLNELAAALGNDANFAATVTNALALKAPMASPAFTGDIYLNGRQRGGITAVAASDVDCSVSNYFTRTVNGAVTFTFSNVPAGSYGFTLKIIHTSGAITWPAAVKWPKNTAPTLTTGKTHLFIFETDDAGTTWRGAVLQDYTG